MESTQKYHAIKRTPYKIKTALRVQFFSIYAYTAGVSGFSSPGVAPGADFRLRAAIPHTTPSPSAVSATEEGSGIALR